MTIKINKSIKAPIYMQIKNEIKRQIYSGELSSYALLPSERKLAEELGVNRSTILNAYRELKAEGLVDSHIGQGTLVLPIETEKGQTQGMNPWSSKENINFLPISWQNMLSQEAILSQNTSIMEMINYSSKEQLISFSAGIAAPDLYPDKLFERWLKTSQNLTFEPYLHTPVEGLYAFRESICQWMLRKGIRSNPEEVMVLAGSQQGLDLLARTYLDPGDTVIVEEPTYMGALQIFHAANVKVVGVPVHEKGFRLDILEALLLKHKPKFIYTMPTFQNPSGRVMDLEHRLKLLELSYMYQVPIIEDDAYSELRYDGEALTPLKALDKHSNVLYLNTFSKFLFPGIRIGWLCGPTEVIKQLAIKKQMTDLHANSIGQWLLKDYILDTQAEMHILKTINAYQNRRDIMVGALEKYAPEGVKWTVPKGGFYIWCELPVTMDSRTLLVKAMNSGVAYVPGETFFTGKQGQNYIRLNFSFPSPEDIEIGIKRLMSVITELLALNEHRTSNNKVEINPFF